MRCNENLKRHRELYCKMLIDLIMLSQTQIHLALTVFSQYIMTSLDTHFPFWPIHSVNKYLVQSIWLDTSTISNSVLRCLIVTIQLVWTFSSFKLGDTIWHSLDTWLKLLLQKVEQVLVSLEEQFVWKLQSSPVLYFVMFCQKTPNVLLRCFGAVSLLVSLY